MKRRIELRKGDRLGSLTVEALAFVKRGSAHYRCKCECGRAKVVAAYNLLNGNTTSCGCAQRKMMVERNKSKSQRQALSQFFTVHGLYRSKVYSHWRAMVRRCTKPNALAFADYGGRTDKDGKPDPVRICEGLACPQTFVAFMGPKPTWRPRTRVSIDRFPLPRGHYFCGRCPECLSESRVRNVRWATDVEQVRNRGCAVFVKWQGRDVMLSALCERFGIKTTDKRYKRIDMRLRRGRDVKKALAGIIQKD